MKKIFVIYNDFGFNEMSRPIISFTDKEEAQKWISDNYSEFLEEYNVSIGSHTEIISIDLVE